MHIARPVRRRPLPCATALVVLASVLALLVAGCSTSGPAGTETGTGGTAAAPSSVPSGPSKSWSDLLARVPGAVDRPGATFQAADMARARAIAGFSPSGDGRDGKTADFAKLGVPPIPSFFRQHDPQSWHEVLGIYPYTPDRTAEIFVGGEVAIAVLEGSFDVAALTEKLKGPEALGPDATTETYGGASYLRQPGDEMKTNVKGPRFMDELGRPVRVLVAPDHLIVSLTDEGMHQAIDAWNGKGAASADPAVAEAAKALDAASALTVFGASDDGSSPSGTGTTRGSTRESTRTSTRGTSATAPPSGPPARVRFTGATLKGDTPGAYLIAVKASPADAQAARDGIETLVESGSSATTRSPWSKLLTIDELRTHGTVVVATFVTERPNVTTDAALKRDNLTAL